MILKILRNDSYAALIGYLLASEKGVSAGQIELHNLVGVDTAVDEMTTVYEGARHRNRIVKPVAHAILAWEPQENPSVDQQKEAARRLLAMLNLPRNQALTVIHDEPKGSLQPGPDGRHFETHIAINRVKFDGSVSRMPFEFVAGERACAEIAREMGFKVIPGRFNGLKAEMTSQGLGNTGGSIAASGGTTIASEIRGDAARLNALRTARSEGWIALLGEFRRQGLDLIEGEPRRRTGLSGGLVMVDRIDPRRKLKISALDIADEKWSSLALLRELGPMPANWRESGVPERSESTTDEVQRSSTSSDPFFAEELLADTCKMARLREARASGQWDVLIGAFRQENLGIDVGYNAKRKSESGLIIVDLISRLRRVKMSGLNSPVEKWGRAALEKELGPWPGNAVAVDRPSPEIEVSASTPSPAREASGTPGRAFDRQATLASYQAAKHKAVAFNRSLRVPHSQQRLALSCQQSKKRDLHFEIRRTGRDLVRTIFGYRSKTTRTMNELLDALFDARMRRLTETHREQRAKLQKTQAEDRVAVPLWPDAARAAQQAYIRLLAENELAEEAETAAGTARGPMPRTAPNSHRIGTSTAAAGKEASLTKDKVDVVQTSDIEVCSLDGESTGPNPTCEALPQQCIPLEVERDAIIGQVISLMSQNRLKRADLEALAKLVPTTPQWVWSQAGLVCRWHHNGRNPHQLSPGERADLQARLEGCAARFPRVRKAVRGASREIS